MDHTHEPPLVSLLIRLGNGLIQGKHQVLRRINNRKTWAIITSSTFIC